MKKTLTYKRGNSTTRTKTLFDVFVLGHYLSYIYAPELQTRTTWNLIAPARIYIRNTLMVGTAKRNS